MVAPRQKKSHNNIVYIVLGVVIVGIVIGTTKFVGHSATTKSKSEKKISVLTYANWNPFEYIKNGKVVGFDLDILKSLSKEAGYQYTIKNTGWDSMFTQLNSGSADAAISGITITKDRQKTYSFSKPYFVSRQAIIVKKTDTVIKNATDLKNKKVAVQLGSTGEEAAESILARIVQILAKTKAAQHFYRLFMGKQTLQLVTKPLLKSMWQVIPHTN